MTLKCFAFHSYKGGTGKTTLASNCAALMAKRGFKVALLDMDVYAPSLLAYFEKEPKRWLNDYLLGEAEIEDVMTPVTEIVQNYSKVHDPSSDVKGALWIGFCSAKKEEIYKIESGTSDNPKSQLRRFIILKQSLIRDYNLDYMIIDTSPGIRYWSLNALAVADTLLLTLKMGDIDIVGTKRLASEIYGSLTKYGTRSYLLFNRVAGYCVPSHLKPDAEEQMKEADTFTLADGGNGREADYTEETLAKETKLDVISAVPCYCDIQFSKKEFLTALRYPNHPFAKQMEQLINTMTAKM